jgi:hypothetical protein
MSADVPRPLLRSGHVVALLARLTATCTPLFVGGCPLLVIDQNAYQTGKVLEPGSVRLAASSILYYPDRASVDVGLGQGWEVGAGLGRTLTWDWNADLGVTRSLYSNRQFFSSTMLQAEYARGSGRLPPLVRVTTAAATSYWFSEVFGIYAPLRLSMLFAEPATFPYTQRVWNDSLGEYIRVPGERVFHGLHQPALTAGLGLAYENGRFQSRLAFNLPVFGPEVTEDSVSKGVDLIPYLGFQVGVRIF